MLIPKHCYSLHKGFIFLLQEDTRALLRHAYSTTPTSVYHKNTQKETYHLQSWDLKSFLEDCFYNLSSKPWNNMENTAFNFKKSEFTTKRYYANILLILKLKKQCLYNAVRGSRDQSWVHTLYVLYEVMCWWFQITKFHAAVEKHFYSKKVISEAFAFLRSTAKHPVAARPRFIFFNENPLAILMLYQSSIQSTSCRLLFPGPTLSQKQCRKITNVANKLAQEFMLSMKKTHQCKITYSFEVL